MANAPPPIKDNRSAARGPAPAMARVAAPPPGVAVPRLEPTLPEGLRLGAFEIKGVIAHSRVAVVYRVSDHSLGIPAAIKEYMPVGVARRGNANQVVAVEAWHEDTIDLGRRVFFAESRALARCDDPALLRVTQLWEINGTAYRVMPLYGGKRLVDLRREMKAPLDEVALRAMLERLLDALGAYHASAGVHGNVTPMNILMPSLDRPVLLGPGKASVLLATELGEPVRSDFEAAFAAPEQHEAADAAVIGPSADLFGLAQTLRYGITGAAPIGHESLRASIHRLLGAGVVSNYSDALLDALSSATATVPAERPQSLDEFRHRLRRLEAQSAAATAFARAPVAAAFAAPVAAPAPVPPPSAAPAPVPAAAPTLAPVDDDIDETIDASSVLGDLGQPTAPPPDEGDAPEPDPLPARDPRIEPTLNFAAFGTPVPPVHAAPGHPAQNQAPSYSQNYSQSPATHATHATQATQATHSQQANTEQRRPHPPEPAAGASAREGHDRAPGYEGHDRTSSFDDHDRASAYEGHDRTSAHEAAHDRTAAHEAHDRAAAYHASMYGDDTALQVAAAYRPKRSLLSSPVLRMTGFILAIGALAIVVILAVSGVWDPRGPELDLRPTATHDGASARPDAPAGDAPVPAEAPPPAVTSQAPAATPQAPAPVAAQTPAPLSGQAAPATSTAAPATATPNAAVIAPAAPAAPSRDNKTSRRRGSTTEAATPDPREACAGRTQFALYRCMQTQCGLARWAAHPECARLRRSDRVDPP